MDGVRTDYLSSIFDPSKFGSTVKRALEVGRRALEVEQFDSIAFTGNSGAAISYILAAELRVALVCVRKKTDNSHFVQSGSLLEGYLKAKRYLFVDDFITSGNTYKHVVSFLQSKLPQAKCVGALLYDSTWRETYMDLPVYSFSRRDFGDNDKQGTFRDWMFDRQRGNSDYSKW
jgi:adenine/guanine phosphoribosyltransferase-like PRPP-binding protein